MGWVCVEKIKNQANEYTFTTFPIINYPGPSGSSNSQIYFSKAYGSSQAEHADYNAAVSIVNDIIGQNNVTNWYGIENFTEKQNFVGKSQFIYGKSGGTGIRFEMSIGNLDYTGYRSWNNATRKYNSFTNYVDIHSISSSFEPGSTKGQVNSVRYGLIMNSDTEEMYAVLINTNKYWYTGYEIPAYYNSAGFVAYIMDQGGKAGVRNLWSIFHDSVPSGGGDEPYGDDDYEEPIGGDGDHDEDSEVVETSPIPIAAATRSGMITAFVPTWGEIQSVADALLDPNIFQILASTVIRAADVMIGLSVFPCTIPATQQATVTANFLGIRIGTGILAHVADNQYLEIDCGDLQIKEYWGNCLDYNPYTNISIFLPFCGMYELDADEVMGKTINVSYRVDIFSGACLATIKINGSVFYQYTGQCSSQIPLNSVSFDNFLSSMIDVGVATATGVGAVKGAAGAVAEAGKAFDAAKASETKSALEDWLAAKDTYTKVKENSGASILGAAVNSVMGGKGFYSHAGAVGGSPGFLAVRKPFVIIKRPEQVIPSMYGKFHGYPSNTTARLSNLSGYTEVSDIRLNIPDATVDEIIECEQLLKGGVVL